MTRQSITLTSPNDEWLKQQLILEEYSSKSEIINDLIRRARQNDMIAAKLAKAEKSGFTDLTANEILANAKSDLIKNA
jgi:antitoxin ParD1/3/4